MGYTQYMTISDWELMIKPLNRGFRGTPLTNPDIDPSLEVNLPCQVPIITVKPYSKYIALPNQTKQHMFLLWHDQIREIAWTSPHRQLNVHVRCRIVCPLTGPTESCGPMEITICRQRKKWSAVNSSRIYCVYMSSWSRYNMEICGKFSKSPLR